MSKEIMQESTQIVECNAFHRGMSVLEANLRNTEDSESTISVLLKGAAEFYGASRASVVEADWELGIGVITYEWCSDGIPAQRDMLQCLPMEKFPRWKKALKANKPLMISDLDGLAKSYPDEAAFFREYGVTTLLAAPFSKRINQGFIAVDDPTRYTDDPVFLFIASYTKTFRRSFRRSMPTRKSSGRFITTSMRYSMSRSDRTPRRNRKSGKSNIKEDIAY